MTAPLPSGRSEAGGQEAADLIRINPNPRIVALLDYALDQVVARLRHDKEYDAWLRWAAKWKEGSRSPQACVDIAHECFAKKEQLVWHTLGQLAWGAKEACYSAPTSGWLVIRYVADAMIAFGVAFPDEQLVALPGSLAALRPPDNPDAIPVYRGEVTNESR